MDRQPISPWEPPPSLANFTAAELRILVRELVDIFVEDGARQIGLLHAAAVAGDAVALARISHSLKGSAQAMAAESMIELSRSLEESARLGAQRDYCADATRLSIAFEETRAAMLAYCAGTLGAG
jgi:HPt (histidine-containing phosphotransfer) domain-containing protein